MRYLLSSGSLSLPHQTGTRVEASIPGRGMIKQCCGQEWWHRKPVSCPRGQWEPQAGLSSKWGLKSAGAGVERTGLVHSLAWAEVEEEAMAVDQRGWQCACRPVPAGHRRCQPSHNSLIPLLGTRVQRAVFTVLTFCDRLCVMQCARLSASCPSMAVLGPLIGLPYEG